MGLVTSILVGVTMLPIYIGWFLLICIIALVFTVWAIFAISLPIMLIMTQKKSASDSMIKASTALRDGEHIQGLERLIRSFAETMPGARGIQVCACIGGKESGKKAVVHFRLGEDAWSYSQGGKNETDALNRIYQKHAAAGALRVPSHCRHECPIANRCPKRTSSREFHEIFRFTVLETSRSTALG